jgi:uncharacterized membrane protein
MQTNHKLYFVFYTILLIILFNFPFLEIANKKETISDVPVLFIYLFGFWIVSIIILYFLSKRLLKSDNKK